MAIIKKILIVDDDPVLSQMYKHIFDVEKNFQTYVAVDGYDGLEKAKSLLPQIILLDIMLPKINGLDVLEKLKADPLTKSIPVVVLTNIAKSPEEAQRVINEIVS
ncbi:response regulator, partial [Patescibacteria group bacterium]|nr:response regulator [Patescibacteria group bacterium]